MGGIGVGLGLGSAVWLDRLGFDVLIMPMPAVMAFSCAFPTGLVFGWLPGPQGGRHGPGQGARRRLIPVSPSSATPVGSTRSAVSRVPEASERTSRTPSEASGKPRSTRLSR